MSAKTTRTMSRDSSQQPHYFLGLAKINFYKFNPIFIRGHDGFDHPPGQRRGFRV